MRKARYGARVSRVGNLSRRLGCNGRPSWLARMLLVAFGFGPPLGCSIGSVDGEQTSGGDETSTSTSAITSDVAHILDFRFSGEVLGPRNVDARNAVVSQLMFMQGILTTAGHGNAQVRNAKIETVRVTDVGDKKRIEYEVSLPVAWPKDVDEPETYGIALPLDVSKLDTFAQKYDGRCGMARYGKKNYWHDFDPKSQRCTFDEADVLRRRVDVTPHQDETKGKYPEYDLLWEDDRLDAVVIFGIIESKDKRDDYGYTEAQKFIQSTKQRIPRAKSESHQASASILADATVTGSIRVHGRPRDVKVDVLVVYKLDRVGPDFDQRYDALTEGADIIIYNGHTDSGEGINELAQKGKVTKGKYQLFAVNGCQSFALLDTTMTDRRREINGEDEDPNGTQYLDVIANALPGHADTLASISSAILDAALSPDAPKDYNTLLSKMPESNIAVVFGEEDNRFKP